MAFKELAMPSHTSTPNNSPASSPSTSPLSSLIAPSCKPNIVDILSEHACEYSPKIAAEILSNASLVGIGEGTHRANEMFQAQSDIIKERIAHNNCRVVFIEADASDVSVISEAMKEGDKEKVTKLLRELSFYTLSNKGINDLINYITEWNKEHPNDPVKLVGLDVQTRGATKLLREAAQKMDVINPLQSNIKTFCELWDIACALEKKRQEEQEDSGPLQEMWKEIYQSGLDLLQRLVDSQSKVACDSLAQWARLRSLPDEEGSSGRDALMAERINSYSLEVGVSAAVIAHNGHLTFAQRSTFSDGMGSQIAIHPYKVLLQLTETGTLAGLSKDPTGEENKPFPALAENDIESLLALVAKKLKTDKPILINIDKLKDDHLAADILKHVFNVNSIGINMLVSTTFTIKLGECCNVILFHRNVTPEDWVK